MAFETGVEQEGFIHQAGVEVPVLRGGQLETGIHPRRLGFLGALASQRRISHFLIEGPPIYAFPNREFPAQMWTSPGFLKGWECVKRLVDVIEEADPQVRVSHWLMVDDVNNRPPDQAENEKLNIKTVLGGIQNITGVQIPLFSRIDQAFLESQFVDSASDNKCATLDASFQMRKLEAVKGFGDQAGVMVLICHPLEFQNQQRMMLERLLNEMKKSEAFKSVSKGERREYIGQVYRHMWVDKHGEVDDFTAPQWNGNSFDFKHV